MQIGAFEGYLMGSICIKSGKCHVCDEEKLVIGIDSSAKEYGDECICLDCMQKRIDEYNNQETTMVDLANTKLKNIYSERKTAQEQELEKRNAFAELHLVKCNDKKCTHPSHELNALIHQYSMNDALNTPEARLALAAAFYVTLDPEELGV